MSLVAWRFTQKKISVTAEMDKGKKVNNSHVFAIWTTIAVLKYSGGLLN